MIFLIFSFLTFLFPLREGQAMGDDVRTNAIEKRVLELINELRAKGWRCGIKYYSPAKTVVWNDRLGKVALNHSLDMAQKRFLAHEGSDGSPEERLSRVGYKWIAYGENLGEGYNTPEEVVKGWMKSSSHCKNIMNPDFKEAGAAYARGSGKTYWTLILASPE